MLEPITEVDPRPEWDAAMHRMLTDVSTARPKRWRFGIAITIPAVMLAASLTGGVLWMQAAISNRNTIHCFARAELSIQGGFPGLDAAKARRGMFSGVQPIQDPIDICSALWTIGELDASAADGRRRNPDGTPYHGGSTTYSVPSDLRVCVMRDGSAAVIPGRADVCAQLGLARLG